MISLVTSQDYPRLAPDDAVLLEALGRRGIGYEIRRWDDESVTWSSFDAVVMRTPWDYYLRPTEFRTWIDARASDGSRVWNPPGILRWNMQKEYLRELAAQGIAVIETEWLTGRAELRSVLHERGWKRAVAKPAVSAGAWRTAAVDINAADAGQRHLDELLASGDVMLQPFVEQIVSEGEWSLVFFGREFSHALLKRPAPGDFRVQEVHGGTTVPIEAPESLVEDARRVLAHLDADLLYARVDGVRDGDRLVLLELEVLEPALYFSTGPGSEDRFVEALVARL